jgi:predicted transcriptional regulator YdeE
MSHRLVELPTITFAGTVCRTNNAVEMSGKGLIGAAWSRLLSENGLAKIPYRVEDKTIHAAYFGYQSDHTGDYDFLLGAAVTEPPPPTMGLGSITFPAAKYAVFAAPSPSDVPGTWLRIWNAGLQRTFRGDFERYQGGNIEIFIGIE